MTPSHNPWGLAIAMRGGFLSGAAPAIRNDPFNPLELENDKKNGLNFSAAEVAEV